MNDQMRMWFYLSVGFIAGVLFLAIASSAQAQTPAPHEHGVTVPDWYDPDCCNLKDCRPVPEEDIEFAIMGGEPVVIHKPTGLWFPKSKWRPSQDERYHVCYIEDSADGDDSVGYCAYLPGGA